MEEYGIKESSKVASIMHEVRVDYLKNMYSVK